MPVPGTVEQIFVPGLEQCQLAVEFQLFLLVPQSALEVTATRRFGDQEGGSSVLDPIESNSLIRDLGPLDGHCFFDCLAANDPPLGMHDDE